MPGGNPSPQPGFAWRSAWRCWLPARAPRRRRSSTLGSLISPGDQAGLRVDFDEPKASRRARGSCFWSAKIEQRLLRQLAAPIGDGVYRGAEPVSGQRRGILHGAENSVARRRPPARAISSLGGRGITLVFGVDGPNGFDGQKRTQLRP